MRAACELSDSEKPQPCLTVDEAKFHPVFGALRALSRDVPEETARLATNLLAGSNLLDYIETSKAQLLDLRTTNKQALVIPLPEISRFSMPRPFKDEHVTTTWALVHGTTAHLARRIHSSGQYWVYHPDPRKCDMPTFVGFYFGLEIGREDNFPEWAARDLMDRASKSGNGQQTVIIGAMYRGGVNHVSFKAGGNEQAQLKIPHSGIVTTSEKYTIAHGKHVGLSFVALKWDNIPWIGVGFWWCDVPWQTTSLTSAHWGTAGNQW